MILMVISHMGKHILKIDTTLNSIIEKIKKDANGRPIRVGVVGVWTEAKVHSFSRQNLYV